MRWKFWCSLGALAVATFVGAGVGLGGCDGIGNECIDGIDNDRDGLVDLNDPSCERWNQRQAEINAACEGNSALGVRNPACSLRSTGVAESDDPQCSDGLDNDGDGYIDYVDGDLDRDAGCTSRLDNDEANPECSDGRDNDGDGRVDWPRDQGCDDRFGLSESAKRACEDGRDNDGDGFVDFPQDIGCSSAEDRTENNPACSDGLDNDDDGQVDFPEDIGCTSLRDDAESQGECSDGFDNDGDGLVDFGQDPSCTNAFDSEDAQACFDGIDNDGDGFIDFPQDPDCASETDLTENSDECSDGVDNDGDGLIDGLDPACEVSSDLRESQDPACADGVDNDGDGRADFSGVDRNADGSFELPGEFPPDPGCLTRLNISESSKPQCSDGIDNDGDGTADYAGAGGLTPDYACTRNVADPLEGQRRRDEGDPSQCNDGIDNDGDTFVDFQREFLPNGQPNPDFGNRDPECSSALDNLEGT